MQLLLTHDIIKQKTFNINNKARAAYNTHTTYSLEFHVKVPCSSSEAELSGKSCHQALGCPAEMTLSNYSVPNQPVLVALVSLRYSTI